MSIFIFPWFSLVFRKHSMNKAQSISAGSTIFLSIFASFVHNFPIPFRSYFRPSIRRDFSQSACYIMESFIFPRHRGLSSARNPSVAIAFPFRPPAIRMPQSPMKGPAHGSYAGRSGVRICQGNDRRFPHSVGIRHPRPGAAAGSLRAQKNPAQIARGAKSSGHRRLVTLPDGSRRQGGQSAPLAVGIQFPQPEGSPHNSHPPALR